MDIICRPTSSAPCRTALASTPAFISFFFRRCASPARVWPSIVAGAARISAAASNSPLLTFSPLVFACILLLRLLHDAIEVILHCTLPQHCCAGQPLNLGESLLDAQQISPTDRLEIAVHLTDPQRELPLLPRLAVAKHLPHLAQQLRLAEPWTGCFRSRGVHDERCERVLRNAATSAAHSGQDAACVSNVSRSAGCSSP